MANRTTEWNGKSEANYQKTPAGWYYIILYYILFIYLPIYPAMPTICMLMFIFICPNPPILCFIDHIIFTIPVYVPICKPHTSSGEHAHELFKSWRNFDVYFSATALQPKKRLNTPLKTKTKIENSHQGPHLYSWAINSPNKPENPILTTRFCLSTVNYSKQTSTSPLKTF